MLVSPQNPEIPLLLRKLVPMSADLNESDVINMRKISVALQDTGSIADARIRVVARSEAGQIIFDYTSDKDALSFAGEESFREVLDAAIYEYHEKFGDDYPFSGRLEFFAVFRIGRDDISVPMPGNIFWTSHIQNKEVGLGLQNA